MSRLLGIAISLLLVLFGCGQSTGGAPASTPSAPAAPAELVIFAASSMSEVLAEIAAKYQAVAPEVTLVFTFDSSGTLQTQIQQGADCDLFLSAAQKQMDQLDAADTTGQNTDRMDFVLTGTRINLLQNKVVLAVPLGNPAGIHSFSDLSAERIELIALGNSDVPVGQYAQEILTNLGLWDSLNAAHKITFATNVKEVVTQVSQAAVDCGIIYSTDAAAAGLSIVAEAPVGTHRPAVYPAAVLRTTKNEAQARAFLDFLQSESCRAIFEGAGFAIAD